MRAAARVLVSVAWRAAFVVATSLVVSAGVLMAAGMPRAADQVTLAGCVFAGVGAILAASAGGRPARAQIVSDASAAGNDPTIPS